MEPAKKRNKVATPLAPIIRLLTRGFSDDHIRTTTRLVISYGGWGRLEHTTHGLIAHILATPRIPEDEEARAPYYRREVLKAYLDSPETSSPKPGWFAIKTSNWVEKFGRTAPFAPVERGQPL